MKKISVIVTSLVILMFTQCSEDPYFKDATTQTEKAEASVSQLNSAASQVFLQDTVNSITSFKIEGLNVTGEIFKDDSFTNVINCTVPDSTDISSLVCTFTTTRDVRKVTPSSGVGQDFTKKVAPVYYVFTNKPYPTKSYFANVTFENDFLIGELSSSETYSGSSLELSGNFGLPLSDYKATYVNMVTQDTIVIDTGFRKNYGKGYLYVPTPESLQSGEYKFLLSRKNLTKEVSGFITVVNQ
jgi:hypothetical protein